jgi:NAD(P)-dependent dehydrogenase (short-subunit alcohol dehydrogenase family)
METAAASSSSSRVGDPHREVIDADHTTRRVQKARREDPCRPDGGLSGDRPQYRVGPELDPEDPERVVRGQPQALTGAFWLQAISGVGIEISRSLSGEGAEPAYCTSKGAVVNLTCQLAVDCASERINVNAICLGFLANARVHPFLDDTELNKTVHDLSLWPYLGTTEVFRDPRTDDRERGRVGRVPCLRRRRDGDRIYAGLRWRLHRGVRGRSSAGLDHRGSEAHTLLARRSEREIVAFLRPKGVFA